MNCTRCQDRGFYGGKLNGEFAGPWKWCSCPGADELRDREPEFLIQSNTARDRLIFMMQKQRLRSTSGNDQSKPASQTSGGVAKESE